ncbi:hypothetical protein DMC61_25185 [Amycolatopsis sp. WAC 04169]|uniref:ArsR family transcriptional regulator n=1 Tax=Amycolatopsis sp. WAC 04169 TaxID=2203197 RepID=UPI000F784F1A|nr:hypothetical protein DMC61_25185 [Amycolatopsis sp. WAC 04169]
MNVYDVAVVGGGQAGLAIGRELAEDTLQDACAHVPSRGSDFGAAIRAGEPQDPRRRDQPRRRRGRGSRAYRTSAVSRHLRQLRSAGLVGSQPDGKPVACFSSPGS